MFKFAFAMLLIGATSVAARPTGTDKGPVDESKAICRTSEVIGSRLQTKKTCMTRAQWDQYERESRTTIEKVQALKPYTGN